MKLNLGCGEDIREGWVNVDVDPSCEPDRILNLEDTPWPFEDSSADKILLDNVLEHIRPDKRNSVIAEIARIANGEVIIRTPVPESGSGWDLTHWNVPSWRWPFHPRWRNEWVVLEINGNRVGIGRYMPMSMVLLLARFTGIRTMDEAELVLRPVGSDIQ